MTDAPLTAHLAAYSDLRLPDGRQRIVRHTPLPEREVQTGIGPVKVKCKRCSAPTLRLMRLGPTLRVYEAGSLHRNF